MKKNKPLGIVFIASLSVFLSVALFNIAVNPYGIFDNTFLENEQWKPEQVLKTRYAKALAVAWKKPDAIILGNSRSEYALDPAHPYFSKYKHPYNLAYSSQTLMESYYCLVHSYRAGNLKKVVLGLDYGTFGANLHKGFNKDILCTEDSPCLPTLRLLKDILSYDHILASVRTLENKEITRFFHQSNGLREPEHNEYFVQKVNGYHNAFSIFESHLIRNFTGGKATIHESAKETFKKMLDFLYKNDIEADFIISPVHVRIWEVLEMRKEYGIKTVEQWKNEVTHINERYASKYKKTPYKIWDFADYNKYTTEELPPANNTTQHMKYYWDTSHYKKELGDLVLNRLMGIPVDGNNFGTILSSQTVQEHLTSIRKRRAEWLDINTVPFFQLPVKALCDIDSSKLKNKFNPKNLQYHHLENIGNDRYKITGNDPYVVAFFDQTFDGHKVPFLGVNFDCSEGKSARLQLFWHDKSQPWFNEEISITEEVPNGSLLFDMKRISKWDSSHNILAVRIDFAGGQCENLKIGNIFLAKTN